MPLVTLLLVVVAVEIVVLLETWWFLRGSSLIPGGPYGGAGNGTWQGDPNPYGSALPLGSGSGGGGGGYNPGAQRGGQGGSGIIVVRYQIGQVDTGSAKATGGSISYYNDKTIHVFNHSGTFKHLLPLNPSPLAVTYVVVAGGGSGASAGGGGGAGQYITGPTTVTAGGSVNVQVGGGGAAPGNSFGIGQDGTPSYFGTPITAGGGGGGGNYNTNGRNGLPGTTGTGSGGGVGRDAPGRSAGGGTSPGANPGGPWNAGGGGGGSGGSGGGGAGAAGSASVGSGARVPGGYGVQLHPDIPKILPQDMVIQVLRRLQLLQHLYWVRWWWRCWFDLILLVQHHAAPGGGYGALVVAVVVEDSKTQMVEMLMC